MGRGTHGHPTFSHAIQGSSYFCICEEGMKDFFPLIHSTSLGVWSSHFFSHLSSYDNMGRYASLVLMIDNVVDKSDARSWVVLDTGGCITWGWLGLGSIFLFISMGEFKLGFIMDHDSLPYPVS